MLCGFSFSHISPCVINLQKPVYYTNSQSKNTPEFTLILLSSVKTLNVKSSLSNSHKNVHPVKYLAIMFIIKITKKFKLKRIFLTSI